MLKNLFIVVAILLAIPANALVLKSENIIVIDDEISNKTVTKAMVSIQQMNTLESNDPIYLVLNTPGGSVSAGIDFIRYAKSSRRPIYTITIYAASMGFQIVQGLPGKRLMAEGGVLMSHRASLGGIGGQIPGELDTRLAFFHDMTADLDKNTATRAGISYKDYSKLVYDEYYATPTKAIKDGFADEQVNLSCDVSLNDTHSTRVNSPFGAIDVEFSDCPLISYPVKAGFATETSINKTLSAIDFVTQRKNAF
jgi:ATP-dependent Clp protease protease subunit